MTVSKIKDRIALKARCNSKETNRRSAESHKRTILFRIRDKSSLKKLYRKFCFCLKNCDYLASWLPHIPHVTEGLFLEIEDPINWKLDCFKQGPTC